MARRNVVPKANPSTALVNVQEEMQKELEGIQNKIGTASSPVIKIDQKLGNMFELPGIGQAQAPLDMVILDFISQNTFWEGAYNPNKIEPPACFAIGDNVREMIPSANSITVQSSDCNTCPNNQWGSDGNGKACKNTRVLAVLPPDRPDDKIYLIRVSPTGLKSFDSYVTGIKARLNTLPIGVITTFNIVPSGNGYTLSFNAIEAKPNPALAAFWSRRAEARQLLTAEPDMTAASSTVAAPARKKAPARRRA